MRVWRVFLKGANNEAKSIRSTTVSSSEERPEKDALGT